MADRYPNRPFPADDYGRGGNQHGSDESDPLAELARLIGQTDPFGATPRANSAPPPRPAAPRESYQPAYEPEPEYEEPLEDEPPAPLGPPQWMQRANIQRQAAQSAPPRQAPPPFEQHEPSYDEPADDYPSAVHPLHRYAAQPAYQQPPAYDPPQAYQQAPADQQDYREASYEEADEPPDPSRYDDALYGQLEQGAQDFQREPAYPDDPYAYQDGYEDEPEAQPRRRGGLLTVAAVLALAVVGTGAAFAYRTYVGGATRSGEPPIIRADNTPTKIPGPSDSSGKTPDRLPAGDGTEKLVPREEAPVDVNARTAGPRVVFPPLNQNANPPSPASVSTGTMPSAPAAASGAPSNNGTMPNSEPRKIKTFSVHGEQPDGAAAPVAAAPPAPAPVATKPAAATRQVPPAATRSAAPTANAPLSLSPTDSAAQASLPPAPAEPRTRMASTTPAQIAPSSDAAPAGEGRFLVQVSSQKSEADAHASYRALQGKYGSVLGSRSPVVKRVDLSEKGKGVVYRAFAGPFASADEATQVCNNLKAAGGPQCLIQRN